MLNDSLKRILLAYGDDDMETSSQEEEPERDSDYDKPNRIMAALHASAIRPDSPPPLITVDSDPEDVFALFDLTDHAPIKREVAPGIKKEIVIPAKYDLYDEPWRPPAELGSPFRRSYKVEVDSQPISPVPGAKKSPFNPEDTHFPPSSSPNNQHESEGMFLNSSGPKNIRNSPEPCCSKSLKSQDSIEMPPPLMLPPWSPRRSVKRNISKEEVVEAPGPAIPRKSTKRRKEIVEESTAVVPSVPEHSEPAAPAAAAPVNEQQVRNVATTELIKSDLVISHSLIQISDGFNNFPNSDEIQRVLSGDYSDVKEVCSVTYYNKKPDKRMRNSQGIKEEEEDDDDDDSQMPRGAMDFLEAKTGELLTKELHRRTNDMKTHTPSITFHKVSQSDSLQL